jgi:hypothetical protein
MESPDEKPCPRMRWPSCVAVSLLLPVLYVLSVGPAVSRGYISEGVAMSIYAPLVMIAEDHKWAEDWIEWFAQLWSP